MKKLEIYIVIHNQKSLNIFRELNKGIDISKFKFILVGDYKKTSVCINEECIVAGLLPNNIENYKSLLTFTAWYALIKNNLINSEYVGIFEYDCKFERNVFELEKELNQWNIIGFNPKSIDYLYLNSIPEFCNLIDINIFNNALKEKKWNATTNRIMSIQFLETFVNWYLKYIPKIFEYQKHSHFHERAVNILAATLHIKNKFFSNYVIHKKLNSHKNKLTK